MAGYCLPNFLCSWKRFGYATIIIIFNCYLFYLTYSVVAKSSESVSSLRLISIIFRHGDRTPTESYPKDPYKDDHHWMEGWGALTNVGKQQMFLLGANLKKRYGNFLGDRYSPNDIYMLSSDHDRCLMSAQLCLAGLYPPVEDQVWKNDLAWQPIPVHTIPKHLDQLIVMRKPCRAYNSEFNRTLKTSYISKINSDNADLYKYLSENSGSEINSVLGVESLYNTLEIEERRNLKLPIWTNTVFPEKMKDLAALSLSLFTFSDKQKRLKGGPLVADIVQHMYQKSIDELKPNRKIFLYSGHDLNIVSSLRVLGFPELIKPETGAALFFELHNTENKKHFIQLFYLRSSAHSEPEVLKIPGCDEKCPLDTLLELTKPFRPENWDEECQAQ